MTEPKFLNRTGETGGRGSLRPSRDRRLPHLAGDTLVGNSFRSCLKRVPCRSRSVKRTCGVDSQKAVPEIHKPAFPDLFAYQAVAAVFSGPTCRSGESRSGWERPPYFASRIGTAGQADVQLACHRLGGSLVCSILGYGRLICRSGSRGRPGLLRTRKGERSEPERVRNRDGGRTDGRLAVRGRTGVWSPPSFPTS